MDTNEFQSRRLCFVHFIYRAARLPSAEIAGQAPMHRKVGMVGAYWSHTRAFQVFWSGGGLEMLRNALSPAEAVFGWDLKRTMLPALAATVPGWDSSGLRLLDMQESLFQASGRRVSLDEVLKATLDEELLSVTDETLLFEAGRNETCLRLCQKACGAMTVLFEHSIELGFVMLESQFNDGCPDGVDPGWTEQLSSLLPTTR